MRRLAVAVVVFAGCQGAPDLSSTAQETVIVSPASHDFGTVTVGQTAAPFTESINPTAGNQSDVVDSITPGAGCGDFGIDAPGLPATVYRVCDYVTCAAGSGAICPPALVQLPCQTTEYVNYTFQTSFHPSVAGPQSCVVYISLNGVANAKSITLSGTGMAPPIDIDVAPASINFGDVRRSTTSSPADVSVRNLGGATLTVSSVSVPAPFTLGGPASFTVPPGGTQPLTVTCTPTATGPVGGNVVISSDDPTTPTITIPLACNGIDSNLGISPSPAVFAPTRVGEPQSIMIDLVNSGAAPTTINSVALTGAGLSLTAAPGPNTPLGAGGSAQVTVAFDAASHGDASGTLTVTTPEGDRTAQITATAKLATMSLTPDGDVDFGPVCAGQMATQSFTVLGNGDGPFRLDAIPDPGAPFTVHASNLPAQVQGSGTNQVTFSVSAAPAAEGVAHAAMTITTDIPSAAPRTINLSVTGLAAGVTPTPAMVDLGTAPLDQTTIGQTIALTNCNVDAVQVSNARIEGTDAGEFTIVAQPTSASIAPTKAAAWLVVMTAHAAGPKEAVFVVDYAGGSAMVPLTGEGLDPNAVAPGTGAARSYYTCNSGNPGGASGAWPLGLALVLAFRRRRRGAR